MSYKDRVVEGAIETPDKKRHVFAYSDLEKKIIKKTSKYRFAGTDGTLVQDFGVGEVGFPMTIYFYGADCDQDADQFEESAGKKGISILEHPLYGNVDVVIESIERRDPLRSSSNQVIFGLVMTETIREEIPEAGEATSFGILETINELYDSVNAAYQDSFLADAVDTIASAAERIESLVNEIAASVDKIASTLDSISSAIHSAKRFINDNIDTLLSAPLDLAESFNTLISAPADAIASIKQRLEIYKDLYTNAIDSVPTGSNSQDHKNQCAEKLLLTTTIIGTMCAITLKPDTDPEGEIDTGFTTMSEATAIASELVDALNDIQNYLDEIQADSDTDDPEFSFSIDPGVTQKTKLVVAQTAKNLVRLSFDLEQERIITLEKDFNLLELAYFLYGTTSDDILNKLIETNELEGDEIIMISKGTVIKYYV